MAMLLKLLPLILGAIWIWSVLTAPARTRAALRANSKPLDDWSVLELAQRFSSTLDSKPFAVRILDMDEINGVALPDGEIYISRGLYEKMLANAVSREEVASVIAHEIGHVALGHHRRRMAAWGAETAALTGLAMTLGRALLGWLGLIAAFALRAWRNSLSQRDEYEADAFAAQLMMRSGLDPQAVVSLFQKLERWEGGAHEAPRSLIWLMSHPPLADRIQSVRDVIAAGPDPEGADGPA